MQASKEKLLDFRKLAEEVFRVIVLGEPKEVSKGFQQ